MSNPNRSFSAIVEGGNAPDLPGITFFECKSFDPMLAFALLEAEAAEKEHLAQQRAKDVADRHRCDCCDQWVERHEDLTASGDDMLCTGCL